MTASNKGKLHWLLRRSEMAHHQNLKMYHEVHSLDMFTDKCKKVIDMRKIRPFSELATASSGPRAVSPRWRMEGGPSRVLHERRAGAFLRVRGWGRLSPTPLRLFPPAVGCPRPTASAGHCDRPPESGERQGRRRPAQGGPQCLRTPFQSQFVGILSPTPNILSVHTAESSISC